MDIITASIINALTSSSNDQIMNHYTALKSTLDDKFGVYSDLVIAVEELERKPNSKGRQATLSEEIKATKVNEDLAIVLLAQDLLDKLQEQPKQSSLVKVEQSFVPKDDITPPKNRLIKSWGLLLIISLIAIPISGYFGFKKIKLNADKRLIQDCKTAENCPGRIEALGRLMEAKVRLKSYNLENANLENIQFNNIDLENIQLKNANLKGANFEGASLYHANLSNANLSNVDLSNVDLNIANLEGANFHNADLDRSYLDNANLERAVLSRVKNLTFSQIKSTCNWKKAFYKVDWNQEKSQWKVDRIANQKFITEISNDKASDREIKADCSRWSESS